MSIVPGIAEVERRSIPFAAEGAGTGALTWGQQAIWREMQQTGWSLNLSGALPLLEGTTVVDVCARMRDRVVLHPALRTRLCVQADGRVRQAVSDSGELPVDVIDVEDDVDPATVAGMISRRSLITPFDHENEWPMRTAVVRHRGKPTYRVWTLSHLATDGMGARTLWDTSGPLPGMSPLELARWEATPQARRHSDAAMRHWRAQLEAMPVRRPSARSSVEATHEGRGWHARVRSRATYLGMMAVAARTKTDTARVLLAIFAVALARVSGVNPVVTRMVVNNRFRPGFAQIIAPVSQHGACTIDVGGATLDEVVARVRRASVSAAKHAYYDPAQLEELVIEVGQARGTDVRVRSLFNDRRLISRAGADESVRSATPPSPAQVQAARAGTTLVWEGVLDRLADQLVVSIEDEPETAHLTVSVDTHHLSRADIDALAQEMEELAVRSAQDPAMSTGVARAVPHG